METKLPRKLKKELSKVQSVRGDKWYDRYVVKHVVRVGMKPNRLTYKLISVLKKQSTKTSMTEYIDKLKKVPYEEFYKQYMGDFDIPKQPENWCPSKRTIQRIELGDLERLHNHPKAEQLANVADYMVIVDIKFKEYFGHHFAFDNGHIVVYRQHFDMIVNYRDGIKQSQVGRGRCQMTVDKSPMRIEHKFNKWF